MILDVIGEPVSLLSNGNWDVIVNAMLLHVKSYLRQLLHEHEAYISLNDPR